MNNQNIRLFTADDLSSAKLIIEKNQLFPTDMLDEMIEPFLTAKSPDIWFVYEQDQVLSIGFCSPEKMTEGTWNLLLIAVDPEHQGKGIGSKMLAYIEALLKSKGQRVLIVETSGLDEFRLTRQFYLKCHYQQEARIRDFYQQGEDKIVFWKTL